MISTSARAALASLLVFTACTSPKGDKGDPGAMGAMGTNGKTSLVATALEPAGAHCPNGGVRLDFGLDADGNGTLDPGEVDAQRTAYLCNGAQGTMGTMGTMGTAGPPGDAGADGRSAAVATSVEPAGANCATGGARVDFGVDANGNAVLDAAEVNPALRIFLCNGAQGAPGAPGATGADGRSALIATAAEPAGANCATGGRRLDFGLDANANGVLDASEVNPGLRSYVCNGAQGAQGIAGPQGAPGTLGAYGDGSAGALNITTNTDWSTTFPGANLQFTDINVSSGVTLIVPSGTILRATGNVTIAGTIAVLPGTSDSGQFHPPPGVALSGATFTSGGLGITRLAATHLVRLPLYGAGAGARNPTCIGGEGGGSFAIFARGTLSVSATGSITANGSSSVNPAAGTVGVVGCGGGGGGVLVLIGKTAVLVSGALRANGGNGSSGFDGNAGNAEGGGGGGGGGIIHLLSSTSPSVTGATQTSAGSPGANSGTSATINPGGGGGACAGNGGAAGSTASVPSAGSPGYSIFSIMPTPESLLL